MLSDWPSLPHLLYSPLLQSICSFENFQHRLLIAHSLIAHSSRRAYFLALRFFTSGDLDPVTSSYPDSDQNRRVGTRSMGSGCASGSSSRWMPQSISRPFGNEEEEEDDDRTLVMSARSTTTEARFGMLEQEGEEEEGNIVAREGEEQGLLGYGNQDADIMGKLGKLRRDGAREGIEKMQAGRLEDVDFDGEEDKEQALGGTWTIQEEKAVVRKMDRRVVLFVALLYLLSFLDRSNIGNARIAGLEKDLRLREGQYEWLLTGFYITYIAFEWMTLL